MLQDMGAPIPHTGGTLAARLLRFLRRRKARFRKPRAALWNSGLRVLAYLAGTRNLRVSHELLAKREDGVERLLLLKGQGWRVLAMNLQPKHNQAIRDEIGDRLRVLLSREPPAVSARLRTLLRQFDARDVPSGLTKVFEARLVKSWLNRFSRPS
jgi:hypothetical protein